jgi:hypothetical protein
VELPRNLGADRLPMKKPKNDPVREDRIHNEAIADANGPEEQVMGWYFYLEDKIRFPFQAKCIATKIVSPLRKGETVEVHTWHRMTPALPTCSCRSAGTVGLWQFPCHSWLPLIPTNPLPRPLATGITGWRGVTASNHAVPAGHYAALSKAHLKSQRAG